MRAPGCPPGGNHGTHHRRRGAAGRLRDKWGKGWGHTLSVPKSIPLNLTLLVGAQARGFRYCLRLVSQLTRKLWYVRLVALASHAMAVSRTHLMRRTASALLVRCYGHYWCTASALVVRCQCTAPRALAGAEYTVFVTNSGPKWPVIRAKSLGSQSLADHEIKTTRASAGARRPSLHAW